MPETQYQMRGGAEIDLLPFIEYNRQQPNMALFGPNTYRENIQKMGKAYFHSKEFPNITFRPATTSESISAAAYGFGENGQYDTERDIFDAQLLQAGWVLRTSKGVFVNPLDAQGKPTTDERILKQLLKTGKKINGIYLLDNDSGFAPYESFKTRNQDCDTFAQGGLARVLEHTAKKEARQLKAIASPKLYKDGVNVLGFDDIKEPILNVVCLDSYWGLDDRLDVGGYRWSDFDVGFAFGMLDKIKMGKYIQIKKKHL